MISLIITTYNRPDALRSVLTALEHQSHQNFEVIIADDGSHESTKDLIEGFIQKNSFPLTYVWQENLGFRVGMIRNKAVAKAKGDYLVFLDGDCVPPIHFIDAHTQLMEKGFFVSGNRVLLSEKLTSSFLRTKALFFKNPIRKWVRRWWKRELNRWFPLLSLPLGIFRKCAPYKWEGVKTCNLGLFRQDFIDVNGFDEQYIGWGFEDSDLIIRLQRKGIKHKTGRYGTGVFHLWHPHNSSPDSLENFLRLQKTLSSKNTIISKGVQQYLPL